MTRYARGVVLSWLASITQAIALGEAEAACRLTIGLVRRLREMGIET